LRGEQEGGRLPTLDRLDLIENGRLLAGTDARNDLPRPSANELVITGAEFALDFLAGVRDPGGPPTKGLGSTRHAEEGCRPGDPLTGASPRRGVRHVTKLVLFPVRSFLRRATGRVGTNDGAVAYYLAGGEAPSTKLVAAAP
jgi:hypothetical protein